MATGASYGVTRQETKVVTITEQRIRLDMSPQEARWLLAVAYKTAGDPEHSRRKHADSISKGLREAGVQVEWRPQSDFGAHTGTGLRMLSEHILEGDL